MPKTIISRRDFLKTTAFLGAGVVTLFPRRMLAATESSAAPAPSLPQRILGRTGLKVSILGVGGVGIDSESTDRDLVENYLQTAADGGINFFDTAANYGKDGQGEKNLSLIMGTRRRKELILATKCEERSYDGAMKQVQTSLKRLKTDRIDLIQMHYISDKDDVKAFGSPGGALTALRKLRDQKVVDFIGMTGHPNFPQVKEALELYDWDTFMGFINPAAFTRPVFDEQLPLAQKKKMGIIAMKTLGGGDPARLPGSGPGKASVSSLLRYAWDCPIHTAVLGMSSLAQLRENIAAAKAYTPLTANERKALVEAVNQSAAWKM